MRKAVVFDEFAANCPFFIFDTEVNNGYGCAHPEQQDKVEESGKEVGRCFCHTCHLGIEAEQEDLEEKEIDWDGLCEDGEVTEGELLLVNICKTADEDEKQALYRYERYIHRYDKKWLDEHGIENTLAE